MPCPECSEDIRWVGGHLDQPACPTCGHPPDLEARSRESSALDLVLHKMGVKAAEEEAREWRSVTSEQRSAYDAGREAYRLCVAMREADISSERAEFNVNPYRRLEVENPRRSLAKWFTRGWKTESRDGS